MLMITTTVRLGKGKLSILQHGIEDELVLT